MRGGAARHAWNSSRRDHNGSTHRDRAVGAHIEMPHSACYVACLDSLVQKNHWFRKITGSEKSLVQKNHWFRKITGSEKNHWFRKRARRPSAAGRNDRRAVRQRNSNRSCHGSLNQLTSNSPRV